MENSVEALYDLYQAELGESIFDPPPLAFTQFLESSLKASLERSSEMYVWYCNQFHFMPYLCWNKYLASHHIGLQIVVLPYMSFNMHCQCSFMDLSEISPDTLPSELDSGDIPNILFLNLNGAAMLLHFHLAYI